MLTENSILLTAVRNPFDPYKSRITLSLEYKVQSIYMYIKDYLPETLEEFEVVASVNGKIVENGFIPLPNSSIVFTQIPAGGGQGNNALRIVASIAVLIISYYAGPALAEAYFASSATAANYISLGIAIAGSIIVNALLPIPTPGEEGSSASYGWGANNIINEGAAFPVVYGVVKSVPPMISMYSENVWVGGGGTPDLQKLNVLYAIADHAVSSISEVQINGSPYDSYEDVTIQTRIGGLSQSVISNFADTKTQQGYGSTIHYENGWYGPYDVPGNDTTSIGIGISFPNGLGYWNNDGNVERLGHPFEVQYRIKDTGGGVPGAWNAWIKGKISAAESTPLRFYGRTDNNYYDTTGSRWMYDSGEWQWVPTPPLWHPGAGLSPDEYQIQIRSLRPSLYIKDRRFADQLVLDYIEGVVKDDFIYPGTSLLSINAVATDQLSGGLPTITCVVTRGNITVYEQDGTPHSVSSSNPAWVCYDILNNFEYGCNVSYERINYTEFETWATFCTTNSYECNIIFDTNMSVPDALAQVSLLGRGQVVQRGTSFGVVIDKSDSPVQMFTMGNIIEDTLSISYIAKKDRVNTIETTFYDKTDDYDAKSFELRTSDFDTNTDIEENKITLDLRGCTDRTQALKLTKFLMNCNETLVQTVEFEVSVDALASNVGDVILVSHDVPDWGASGDVISATSNTIVIDRAIETQSSPNYRCIVRHYADDTLEEVALVDPAGVKTNTFTLTGTWSVTPSAHDLYIIGIQNQSYRDFRITRISRTQEMRRKVTALEYNSGVYSDSASIADYEEQPHLPEVYSGSVNAYEIYRKESGIMKTIVAVTWRGYGGLFYLYVKEESDNKWRLLGTYSYAMSAEWKDSEPGKTYIFAVSTTPNPGEGETVTITVSGYTYNPPRVIWPVTGLEIFGQGNNTIWQNRDLKLRWNMISSTFSTTAGSETTGAGAFPPITEFGGYRIRISDQNGNLRREIIQIENTYNYTYERNSEDGYVGTLSFTEDTGTFTAGEWIYQYPSGAYAKIVSVGNGSLSLSNIVGTFVNGQAIYQTDYGSELWDTDASVFTSGTYSWAAYGNNTIANVSNSLQITYVDNATGAQSQLYDAGDLSSNLTLNSFYVLSCDSKVNTGAVALVVVTDGTNPSVQVTETDLTSKTIIFKATSTTGNLFVMAEMETGEIGYIDNISLKQITNAAIASGTVSFASAGSSSDPEPNLIVQIWARDKYGQESVSPAILSVSNPAPSAPSGLSSNPFPRAVWFTWQKNTDIDFDYYKFRYKVESEDWGSWTASQDPEQVIQLSQIQVDTYGSDAQISIEVKAVDTFGNESSTSSLDVSALTFEINASDIDDYAITATKRSDKIVVLTGDSWTDNDPSAGYISWNAHTLVYNGVSYSIEAGNTNQTYLYWDGSASSYSISDSNPGSFITDGQFVIATNVSGVHDLAWNGFANAVIGSSYIELASIVDAHISNVMANKVTAGTLTGLNIVGNTIRTSTDDKCVMMTDDGIRLQSTTSVGKFNQFVFNDGTLFGSGSLAYIHHRDFMVPFYIAAEQTVADFHFYNRGSNPSGAAENGDVCVVNGKLMIYNSGWTVVGAQS